MAGGDLAANGTVAVSGGLLFSSGAVLSGTGTLTSSGTVTIADAGVAAQLHMAGGVTWSNAGAVAEAGLTYFGETSNDTATIDNQAGATFNLTSNDASLSVLHAGTYALNNAGTLAKTGGISTSRIGIPIVNTGLVTAISGTLELDGGGTLGGTIGGGPGAVLLDGTFTTSGNPFVTFNGGVLFGSDAVLTGTGTLTSSGAVAIADGGVAAQLNMTAGATWSNAGTVADAGLTYFGNTSNDTATIDNLAGAVFDLTSNDASLSVLHAGTYALNNAGTLAKTGGISTSRIGIPIVNTGLVTATSGTLELDGGGTLGGTIGGGPGAVLLDGTFTTSGNPFVAFNGGVLFGSDAVLSGTGTLTSSGAVAIADGGVAAQLDMTAGATWSNAGTVADAGLTYFGNTSNDTATVDNLAGAAFDLTSNDASLSVLHVGTYALDNAGTLAKIGGISTSRIGIPIVNTGLVTAATGTLE